MKEPTTSRLDALAMDSPVGRLTLVASPDGLRAVLWPDDPPSRVPSASAAVDREPNEVLEAARGQLDEYFGGERAGFDLPLDPVGTDFQLAVWDSLVSIEHGSTATYGQIASGLGRPGAARAVGAAIGRNPLSIVVPCHRVIGADGSLTGFAGGPRAKQWLLDHELVARVG